MKNSLAWMLLLMALCLPVEAQTDPEGRALAWRLYEAYQAGPKTEGFSALLLQNPVLTRRAFVSSVEYATEIYQGDLESARRALTFAQVLANEIQTRFQDPEPAQLLARLLQQDPSSLPEFLRYAAALYPGYSSPGSSPGQPGAPFPPSSTRGGPPSP